MVDEEITDPQTFRHDLDEALAMFLRRACAAGRSARFSTAAAMQSELRGIRSRL
jgi:hypothetical protein